jgi:Cdc6-like AAA superfamily ATPase
VGVDEVLNPYAPGAGTPPPELAGRDGEQTSFGVMLKRLAAGRPEQNLALWGLRGVGKTVLLNRFATEAVKMLVGAQATSSCAGADHCVQRSLR